MLRAFRARWPESGEENHDPRRAGAFLRQVLAERRFPLRATKFLASERSAGKHVEFQGKQYPVELLRPEAFGGVDIVLSSTPATISREWSPIAARASRFSTSASVM